MRGGRWICGIAALLLVLAGQAWAGKTIAPGEFRTVSGKVTAVTPDSRTVLVEAQVGGKSMTVGVVATDKTKITAKDKAAAFSDIRTGERVTVRYTREGDQLLAERIAIR